MNRAGFTMIELVIVLAIAMMMFLVIGGLASNTYPKNQLHAEAKTVIQTIRQAQVLTLARKEGVVWGVHRTDNQIVLFAGESYEMRDQTFDRVHLIPSGISISGLSDIVFDALKGTTAQSGQIILTSIPTSESITLTINQNGVVSH